MNKRLTKTCRCSLCHQKMLVGEEFEWRQATFTRHAFNSGLAATRKQWLPCHVLEVGCMREGWEMPGGGYDKHIAALKRSTT